MNAKRLCHLISSELIKDLRDVLEYFDNPDVNYQFFWLIRIRETGKYYYVPDPEYFFSSTPKSKYEELSKFEREYYEVKIKRNDLIYYDLKGNFINYFQVGEEPSEVSIDRLEVEFDEYYNYEELKELMIKGAS